uniref:Tetratricopeptide repeat protein 9C n=1 Tax=Ditylenchus dipsaci TaxID=166011 RepID=A0A915D9R9_9BILA
MQANVADLRCALDKAHEIKEKANEAYKQKDFSTAMRFYHQTVLEIKGLVEKPNMAAMLGMLQEEKPVVESDAPSTPEELLKKEGIELIAKCYNNLAACILNGPVRKQQDYLRAVTYCDKVLAKEPDNQKAIFRKGCAYKMAEKYEKAIEQFKQCPQNIQALALLKECRLKEKEEDKKRDAQMRANFAKQRLFCE